MITNIFFVIPDSADSSGQYNNKTYDRNKYAADRMPLLSSSSLLFIWFTHIIDTSPASQGRLCQEQGSMLQQLRYLLQSECYKYHKA